LKLPPSAPAPWLIPFGKIEYEQASPDWLMLNIFPQTLIVPFRALLVPLASTVKLMLPFPVPELVEWIQLLSLGTADHEHALPAVIPNEPLPVLGVKDAEVLPSV